MLWLVATLLLVVGLSWLGRRFLGARRPEPPPPLAATPDDMAAVVPVEDCLDLHGVPPAEVAELGYELDSIGTPHHIERFDGGHQWPPTELAARAVAWLELQAMQRGLVPRNQSWIDSVYASWSARAARRT